MNKDFVNPYLDKIFKSIVFFGICFTGISSFGEFFIDSVDVFEDFVFVNLVVHSIVTVFCMAE